MKWPDEPVGLRYLKNHPGIHFKDMGKLARFDFTSIFYIFVMWQFPPGIHQLFSTKAMRRIIKSIFLVLFILILVYIGLVFKSIHANPEQPVRARYEKSSGTAIVITGAAARIAQEAALLEQLERSGWLNDVCFISGSSSGALNAVILNAILDKKFTWERYQSILFTLTDDKIYVRNEKSLPVNVNPFRSLLIRVVNDSLGYSRIGDLPVHSSISVSDILALPPHADTYRLSNIKINQESNPEIDLVEALMATSAIPLIFPPAKFNDSSGLPRSSFIDGGLAEDHLPYTAVLQFEKLRQTGVDTLIIVSRKSDIQPNMKDELQNLGINESRLSGKLRLWFEGMAKSGFIKSMKQLQKQYPDLAKHTFVYIPDFEENFPLLNFNNMQQQYSVTAAWAQVHKPVLLSQYLIQAEEQEKKRTKPSAEN